MGVDNLKTFISGKIEKIFYNILIAIFNRPFYSLNIATSKVSSFFKGKKRSTKSVRKFKYMNFQDGFFLDNLTHPDSSSEIRKTINEKNKKIEKFLKEILEDLSDLKAENVVKIDIKNRSALGDYIIIASGTSSRHINAIASKLLRRIKTILFQLKV